jgi:mannonate dehydratase
MRVGVRTESMADDRLRYIKQLGVDDVFVDHAFDAEGPDVLTIRPDHIPTTQDLVQARKRVEDAGIRFAGVQSLTGAMYDDIMFGRPGKADQIESITQLIRNMGKANIPILGYQWNPRAAGVVKRTSRTHRIRGNAQASAFDLSEVNDAEAASGDCPDYTETAFWSNYEAFLSAVLPVAEEAGVRLALHPADPPTVERLEGIPRLFRDIESFERAMDLVPSDNHGLKLCLGCFSQMGADVAEVVRTFGRRDEIVFVHFRDVVGTMPCFHETFVDDEASNFDEYQVMTVLDDVGFDGVIVPDHVPVVEGDTDWGHRARGFTAGYLRGLFRGLGR